VQIDATDRAIEPLPIDLFNECGLAMANPSPLHSGWGEGPALKLNGKLAEMGADLGTLPTFDGNKSAHRILMEFWIWRQSICTIIS
jgi:hypothetical protein